MHKWISNFINYSTIQLGIWDDGNGIDVEQVKRKAVEKGALTQEQVDNLDDKGYA